MKLIKALFLITVTFIFSGCYFLDYVIPEEYFADEYEDNSSFMWLYHPAGIQCERTFFHSLQGAKNSLESRGVKIFDSKTILKPQRVICGNPTETFYYVKINGKDLNIAISCGWNTGCRNN